MMTAFADSRLRLYIGLLGFLEPHLAEVEDRHLDFDTGQ
jgi:hypothetical protein